MEKQDTYVFPAVFKQESESEISVVFPDLDVVTRGKDNADALASARELLGCMLFGAEEAGSKAPKPSDAFDLQCAKGEVVVLVDVYMPTVRLAQKDRVVDNTVKIPAWLNTLAAERNLDYSTTLQNALKAELGMK